MSGAMRRGGKGLLLPIYLALCVVLGGSSSAGFASNAILQLVGIAILWRYNFLPDDGAASALRGRTTLRLLLIAFGFWAVVQLFPLPGSIWLQLPGREVLAGYLAAIDVAPGWRPLAIEWERTVGSLLAFIPALAVLALALQADAAEIMRGAIALLAMTLLATIVGALQLSMGPQSPLYFYAISTTYASSGFFANSNHFATLLNVGAALAFAATRPPLRKGRGEGSLAWLGWLALALYLVANTFLNRSLAGLALGFMVAAYGFALHAGRARSRIMRVGSLLLIVSGALGAIAAILFAPRALTEEMFSQTTDVGTRLYFWRGTWQAILDTFPVGTGLGNFRWFFPMYEDPDILTANYVNHAHNDWLEFVLEGGVFAIAILALVIWLIVIAARAHLRGPLIERLRLAAPYVGLAVIALHSFVDYPLRTATIGTLAALLLAMALRGLTFDPEVLLQKQKGAKRG